MKKIVIPACVALCISFTSCKEKGPLINFGGGATATDTTYTTAVEAKQERMALLEEFTGASCPPCPNGHVLIYGPGGIKAQHPEHVAVIAYHIKNFPQAEPVHDHSKYDFRTDDATEVGKTIFGGVLQMPIGGVNRIPVSNSLLLDRTSWSSQVNTVLSKTTPVNIHITPAYDAATREVTVKVKIAYTENVIKKQNLTLAIIEDKVKDAQKSGLDIIDAYEHNSILRDIITPFNGDPILSTMATKEAGRVYERTIKFNVNASWNADNCQLVAFIYNTEGDDKEVVQVAEVHLK